MLRVVTFKIEPSILEKIDMIATRYNTTRSDIIRKALEEYIKQEEKNNVREESKISVEKIKLW